MEQFTPIASFAGGLLIGTSAAVLLLLSGRVAGISGIVGGIFGAGPEERRWRLLFVAGLLTGGFVLRVFHPEALEIRLDRTPVALILAGLLVGFGTRLGSGCTSGHGVCGIGRASGRSLAATATFMATAVAVVFVVQQLFGGRV